MERQLSTRIRNALLNDGFDGDARGFFFAHIRDYHEVPNLGRKSVTEICEHIGYLPPPDGFPQFSSDIVVRNFAVANWRAGLLSADDAMRLVAGD